LAQSVRTDSPSRKWWVDSAGRFANDPVFDEIVRLGQQYRRSLKPVRGGKHGHT
jgi:hypothetical protein